MGAIGCVVPYYSTLLAEAGLADGTVALVLNAIPVGMLLGGPVWATIADWSGAPLTVLRVASALCLLAAAVLAMTTDGLAMAAVLLFWSLFRSAQTPFADALTVHALGGDRRSYGRVRAFGSVAFLTMALLSGSAREIVPRAPLFLALALLAATFLWTFLLPGGDAAPERPRWDDVRRLLRHPVILPFLALSVLHGVMLVSFDNFLALHVRALGLPSTVVGAAVALAVAVEVAVLWTGRWWLDRFGPDALLLAAALVGVPHWWLTAHVTDPVALVALQGLRGVEFGAYWIAGVAILSEQAPPALRNTAQALLPSSSFGVGFVVAMALGAAVLDDGGTRVLFRGLAGLEALCAVLFAGFLMHVRRRAVGAPP